jgi:DNA-binding PadR family transcriptional regulator
VEFERVQPPRGLASFLGQSHFPGMGWFSLAGVHVGLESWLERDVVMRLDADPDLAHRPRRARAPRLEHGALFLYRPGATTTLTDILADVLGGRMAVSRRDGRAGQDVLRRVGEASVLILISLADGPKHGYALIQDIKELAGVELGPGTLYGALDRLERLGLIESLPAEDRRRPYRITAPGAAALRVHLDSLERVSAAGRLRLRLGGI